MSSAGTIFDSIRRMEANKALRKNSKKYFNRDFSDVKRIKGGLINPVKQLSALERIEIQEEAERALLLRRIVDGLIIFGGMAISFYMLL